MSDYVYADTVPTGATCPELRMRVDDIEAAYMRYVALVDGGAPLTKQAHALTDITDALVAASQQAVIEVNALHDTANGAF